MKTGRRIKKGRGICLLALEPTYLPEQGSAVRGRALETQPCCQWYPQDHPTTHLQTTTFLTAAQAHQPCQGGAAPSLSEQDHHLPPPPPPP